MQEATILSAADRLWLIALARRVLQNLRPRGDQVPADSLLDLDPLPESVRGKRGAFVTLHRGEELRGCIGYVLPLEPLYRAVIENTVNAARRDPRFPPVGADEAGEVRIEISVLSVPCRVTDAEEIEVGRHGLIVGCGTARGLLLPQVAVERGWDRETFLEQTCAKAGLPLNAWRQSGVEIESFSAEVFREGE